MVLGGVQLALSNNTKKNGETHRGSSSSTGGGGGGVKSPSVYAKNRNSAQKGGERGGGAWAVNLEGAKLYSHYTRSSRRRAEEKGFLSPPEAQARRGKKKVGYFLHALKKSWRGGEKEGKQYPSSFTLGR